ncbi:hypothetical protein AAMO2058_000642700 [Amorphochlora amoebiformis]
MLLSMVALSLSPPLRAARSLSRMKRGVTEWGNGGRRRWMTRQAFLRGGGVAARAEPESKLRILCLHGYTQSATYFSARTGALRKACKSIADFSFVDAPHEADALFLEKQKEETKRHNTSYLAWWNMEDRSSRPSIALRYTGARHSLDVLKTHLDENGPYDGVFGFSQGASAAALLCAKYPSSFRFAVLVSGFVPRDEELAHMLRKAQAKEKGIQMLRSLHVFGANDTLVLPERSRELAGFFGDSAETHQHTGGHFVPSGVEFRKKLKEFLSDVHLD